MSELIKRINGQLDETFSLLKEAESLFIKGEIELVKPLLDKIQPVIEKILSHSKEERSFILSDANTRNKFNFLIELQNELLNNCRSVLGSDELSGRFKISTDLKSLKAYRESFSNNSKNLFEA